jgi:hypothetical protein
MTYWLVRATIGMDALLLPWEVVGQDYLPFDSSGAKPFETRREARKAIEAGDYGGRIEIWTDERVNVRLVTGSLTGSDECWVIDTSWPPHRFVKPHTAL